MEHDIKKISFASQLPKTGITNFICGTGVSYTVETPESTRTHRSTLEGLIVVGDRRLGLTSAHTFVSEYMQNHTKDYPGPNTSSDSGSSTSSKSDWCESSKTSKTDLSKTSPTSQKQLDLPNDEWVKLLLPRVLAYLGRGTTTGDWKDMKETPEISGLTLIEMGEYGDVHNGYFGKDSALVIPILGHLSIRELEEGLVHMVTSCGTPALPGYLLKTESSIILRGSIIPTRKI